MMTAAVLIVPAILAFLIFMVWPLRLAAGWLGADNVSWTNCFVAALLASVLGGAAMGLVGGGASGGAFRGLLASVAALSISGVINRFFLGTSFGRGVLISLVGSVLIPGVIVVVLLLVALGLGLTSR